MTKREQDPEPKVAAPVIDTNGGGLPSAMYCAYCGVDLDPAAIAPKRFGEPFCSEVHADAFALEARAERAKTGSSAAASAPPRWNLKRVLKLGLCCGAPVLALVFLAGGGGALLGAGTAVLPVLAALACPLGMYFMMRRMKGHTKAEGEPRSEASADAKEPRRQ